MTRANIYLCGDFVAELGGDSYPGGDHWLFLGSLDTVTQSEFCAKVTAYVREHYGDGYLPPVSDGVGNWAYEFMWYPTRPLGDYRNWDLWVGRVLVRQIDEELTWKRFGHSYYQVPGPWVPIADFSQGRESE